MISSAAGLIRAGGRSADVVAFEMEVVSFFMDAADILGVPKSVAAIYGLCFASSEPLSFADLDERLEISSGSISQGLRVLREIGALKTVSPEGLARSASPLPAHRSLSEGGSLVAGPRREPSRREYFTPELELRKLTSHFIEERLENQLKAGKTRLQAMKAAVPTGQNGMTKELKARLKYLQSWHDQSRALLPVIKTFLRLT